jgi:hypothetical protein
MRIHNLYTDASGQSHFRDIDVEWVEERRGSKLSKRLPATGIIFRETQAEHDIDWHPAPRRQYIINPRCGGEDNSQQRREPGNWGWRGDSGRGHHRQGPLVATCRGQDPAFDLRTGRIGRYQASEPHSASKPHSASEPHSASKPHSACEPHSASGPSPVALVGACRSPAAAFRGENRLRPG